VIWFTGRPYNTLTLLCERVIFIVDIQCVHATSMTFCAQLMSACCSSLAAVGLMWQLVFVKRSSCWAVNGVTSVLSVLHSSYLHHLTIDNIRLFNRQRKHVRFGSLAGKAEYDRSVYDCLPFQLFRFLCVMNHRTWQTMPSPTVIIQSCRFILNEYYTCKDHEN